MSVLARFRCHLVANVDHGGFNDPSTVFTLAAVYSQGDNTSWSKAVPQGDVKLTITNPAASGEFIAGKEYWVEFTPVFTRSIPRP